MSKESSLVLLLLSTLILFVMLYSINKTNSRKKLVRYFSILIVLLLIWNLGLTLQLLLAERLGVSPIYFDFITYFGIVFVPVTLLLIAVTFIKPDFKLKNKHFSLLIVPIISLATLYTNDFHHLFYIKYSTVLNEIIYGPFLYLHLIYTYSLIAISLILLLRHSIKYSGAFSIQSLLFLAAIAIPVIINIAGMLNIFNGMDIYLTPISFAASFLLIAISIFKFDFLNINTIATQLIIKAISDS